MIVDKETESIFNLNPDMSQILDDKGSTIQSHPEMPSPTEGQDGEIRVGIRFKNQVLMATKVDGIWYFNPMSTLGNLSADTTVKEAGKWKPTERAPAKKGNILTEIFTGTTHASTSTYIYSDASTRITTNNIITIHCGILAVGIWYGSPNNSISAVFVDSTKKFGVASTSAGLTGKPYRAVIFYRNTNF